MRIVVNTRLLLKDRLEGIGWFTYESLKRICRDHPEVEFIFVFDRQPDPEFLFAPNIHPLVVGPQARHPFLFYLWFNHRLPALLNRIKPDLFLSPDGYHALPYKGKSLIVIHDLNFEHYPNDLPWLVRKYYRYYFPKFASQATRIATVSEFSRQDIIRQYEVPAGKIDVVYDGVNEIYTPSSQEEILATRKELTSGDPYFLFIGALHPRKNLVNLFRAFDLFRQKDKQQVKLVITGKKKWWTREMEDTYYGMKHKDSVIFTGRLSVQQLQKILSASMGLVYISYFEGFGIPVLEAFACEVPVIVSNKTSLPEIAGEAALYADPFSPESIADAMTQLAGSQVLRRQLVLKGKDRLSFFSWDKTASLLWESIQKTMQP